jgi:hypothetical protein
MSICIYYRDCPEGVYSACSDNTFVDECPFREEEYRARHNFPIWKNENEKRKFKERLEE